MGNVTEPLLSAGKIARSGGIVHLEGSDKSYADLGGRMIPVRMVISKWLDKSICDTDEKLCHKEEKY